MSLKYFSYWKISSCRIIMAYILIFTCNSIHILRVVKVILFTRKKVYCVYARNFLIILFEILTVGLAFWRSCQQISKMPEDKISKKPDS